MITMQFGDPIKPDRHELLTRLRVSTLNVIKHPTDPTELLVLQRIVGQLIELLRDEE